MLVTSRMDSKRSSSYRNTIGTSLGQWSLIPLAFALWCATYWSSFHSDSGGNDGVSGSTGHFPRHRPGLECRYDCGAENGH